jgi:hypothetical protein
MTNSEDEIELFNEIKNKNSFLCVAERIIFEIDNDYFNKELEKNNLTINYLQLIVKLYKLKKLNLIDNT